MLWVSIVLLDLIEPSLMFSVSDAICRFPKGPFADDWLTLLMVHGFDRSHLTGLRPHSPVILYITDRSKAVLLI